MDFSYMKDFMDRLTSELLPGNSIVVYHDNKKVFEYSSGYSDYENKIPMAGDEFINIYSCSKITTMIAALQLLERGFILLDDPLYEYIPEYRSMKVSDGKGAARPAKNTITLRHLFTMTAGLTYNLESDGIKHAYELTNGRMDTLCVVKCIAEDPLAFEPGERWNYSLCHDVLAAVVEVISGKKFSDYAEENIFAPLSIRAVYHHTPEIRERMAQQYLLETDGSSADFVEMQKSSAGRVGKLKNVGKDNAFVFGNEYDSGGAGITTTVGDYAKLINSLANGGSVPGGGRILSRKCIDLMQTNQLSEEQSKYMIWKQLAGYGYGLGVRTMTDKAAGGAVGEIGEFGWCGAAGAMALIDPKNRFALFYAHHMLNNQEEYYMPRLRNVAYTCMNF